MKKQKKSEINAFYEMYKIEKGEKMFYKFKCKNCGKVEEKEIAIKDYDREKENQTCPDCKGKMERVIEWQGIASGSGEGWFGKSDGSNAI